MKTTEALVRVSGDGQDTERQYAAIKRYASERGETLDRWVEDKLSRDLSEHRVEFQKLIKRVEAGEVRKVLVEEFERFGVEGPEEFFYYAHIFRRQRCELVSVKEGNLLDPAIANTVQNLFRGNASRERQVKTSYAMESKKIIQAQDGEALGGIPPWGFDKACYSASGLLQWTLHYLTRSHRVLTHYDANGNPIKTEERLGQDAAPKKAKNERLKWIPSSECSRIADVQELFTLWTSSVLSTMTVAKTLNAKGKHFYGHPWNERHVEYVLRNPIYKGDWTYFRSSVGRFHEVRGKKIVTVEEEIQHKLRYEAASRGKKRRIQRTRLEEEWTVKTGAVEVVVSTAVWAEAQRRLDGRDKRNHPPRKANTWLCGLLYCDGCQEKMYAFCQTTGRYGYHCQTYTRQYRETGDSCKCTCGHNVIMHEVAERVITDKLAELGITLERQAHEPAEALAAAYLKLKTGLDCSPFPVPLTQVNESHTLNNRLNGIKSRIEEKAGYEQPKPSGKQPSFRGGFAVDMERWGNLNDYLAERFPGKTPAEVLAALNVDPSEAIEEKKAANADRLTELQAEFKRWVAAKVHADSPEEREVIAAKVNELKADMERCREANKPPSTLLDVFNQLREAVASIRAAKDGDKLKLADVVRRVFSRVVLRFRKVPWGTSGTRFRYEVLADKTQFVLSSEMDSTLRGTREFTRVLAEVLAAVLAA